LSLIQIFGLDLDLDPNIRILSLKKSKLILLKKWICVENLIQLFGSKLDVDWIIKNPIYSHPYPHSRASENTNTLTHAHNTFDPQTIIKFTLTHSQQSNALMHKPH